MTLVAGDFVRFAVGAQLGNYTVDPFDEVNANSPMYVSAYNAASTMTTCKRETTTVGVFPEIALTKVTPPVSVLLPPMVPDALP